MGADRVEVAQGDALQSGVGRHRIAQDILAHLFRVAVGRGGRFAGRLLRDGLLLGFAVDGARRREDDVPPSELAHQRDDVHERREVVAVVLQRFLDRFTDGLRGGEMDHRIEFVLFEDLAETLQIAAVDLHEGDIHAGDLADPLDGAHVAVRKVVDDDDVVAGIDKLYGGVRTDVTGSAAHQDTRFFHRRRFVVLNHKDTFFFGNWLIRRG